MRRATFCNLAGPIYKIPAMCLLIWEKSECEQFILLLGPTTEFHNYPRPGWMGL